MAPRICPRLLVPALLVASGCPQFPPGIALCEEGDPCETTGPVSEDDGGTPTTSDGPDAPTDTTADPTAPDAESGEQTTAEPDEPPVIIDGVVIPDYIDDNGLLKVSVSTQNADAVHMLLEGDVLIELEPARPNEFVGTIEAFTGLENAKHKAVLTPRRGMAVGAAVDAYYVIALPPPGHETGWHSGALDMHGSVAAIAVLPDGRPVELGTSQDMGTPHCYLHLRDKTGQHVELVPLLDSAHCRAIDLNIDRDTGVLHLLLERQVDDDPVWWAGEISSWGKGLKNLAIGEVGDTAHALAARPDVVAVCGARSVPTMDKLDALAILLRPGEPPEARLFDYRPSSDPNAKQRFTETARDCTFADDTLVLVGEANGGHEENKAFRDRLMVIESNLVADAPTWTVAGPDQGIQSRSLALDLDGEGRYVLAGYTCFDTCDPTGEVWLYAPGGALVAGSSLGPLGSQWFGPHDIAWSPAGYAVVAFGELQGNASVFKVQAFAPGMPSSLWTFVPNDKQGPQMALAVAVGPYGEVYAGGIGAEDHPSFARIGG